MKPFILVDTGAWYALVDRKDPNHERGVQFLKDNRCPLLTTNFILDEAITLVRYRLGHSVAVAFAEPVRRQVAVSLVGIVASHEDAAWDIFVKHKDKAWSFTDCTSFAVMQELHMKTAFSFDRDFEQFGFSRVP
ncbi:MAG TPA: type II toxin-antitoxin system VapC family toxin [Candidatus Xenobia bacterium]